MGNKTNHQVEGVKVWQLTVEQADEVPANEVGHHDPSEDPPPDLWAKPLGSVVVSPHKPADWLRNDVEDVYHESSPGVALPGNVGHGNALDKAEDKGDLPPLHPVNQGQGTKDPGEHPDPAIGGDEVDPNLQQ